MVESKLDLIKGFNVLRFNTGQQKKQECSLNLIKDYRACKNP